MNTEEFMRNMKVKIKKTHPDAIIPKYAKLGDAGLDLTATSISYDEYGNICYGTGLAFEIPEGYVGLVFPRSSICKEQLLLSNAVGVIDSGYRGEVSFKFKPSLALDDCQCLKHDSEKMWTTAVRRNDIYKVGDRVGQMIIMPYPSIEFEEVEELSQTERGEGSYGSSGK